MGKPKIAIFGSTSHIAKGLTFNFLDAGTYRLHLFTRSPDKQAEFLETSGADLSDVTIHEGYSDLPRTRCEAVINCVGVGTASRLQGEYSRWFTVTEKFDNLAIDYVATSQNRPIYISLSSGAVYGNTMSAAATEGSCRSLAVNRMVPSDYYSIARLNAEAKHRSLSGLNIVDLRIFAYFSRFIDLSDGYLLSDIIRSVRTGQTLAADPSDFVRDFIHPLDLFSLVCKCVEGRDLNDAFDAFSAGTVTKSEILAYFETKYGLRVRASRDIGARSATGQKAVYCSAYRKAESLGYAPRYTSMDAIRAEAEALLGG